uniref:BTB domain-containing protein n=1 Tax=Trichuris muris TaxID=70415 RepID=A0A5S6QPF6_TRIMR
MCSGFSFQRMEKQLKNCTMDKDGCPPRKENCNRWVSLNVGGQTFVTSKQTLSRNRESFLFSLCEGNLQSDKDENGAFLIDRNPHYFAPVLDYLRHGKLIINKDVSEEGVLEEAEFYNLPGLIKLCKDRISSRDVSKTRTKRVHRLLHCYNYELAEMVASISDGWKLQQVFLLSPEAEYVCVVWKDFPDTDLQRLALNGFDGLPGRFLA